MVLRFINIPFISIKLQKGEFHRLLGSADRPLILPLSPDHRSGLVPIHTPSQSLRLAGRVVLVPGAESAHVPSVWTHVLQLWGLCCRCCCRRCSLVVAAAPVVGAAPVAAPVVAAAPDADPIAGPVAASDPVADAASPLRAPWAFGILGSLGMPC